VIRTRFVSPYETTQTPLIAVDSRGVKVCPYRSCQVGLRIRDASHHNHHVCPHSSVLVLVYRISASQHYPGVSSRPAPPFEVAPLWQQVWVWCRYRHAPHMWPREGLPTKQAQQVHIQTRSLSVYRYAPKARDGTVERSLCDSSRSMITSKFTRYIV